MLHARERRSRGVHLAEGRKVVREALRSGRVIELLHTIDHQDLIDEFPEARSTLVAPPAMRRLSDAVTPPGVVAVVETPAVDAAVPTRGPLLVLDALNDPGNLGTLIRSAAALGATAVIVTGSATDPFGPKAVRASAGACYRLPILRRASLSEALAEIARAGLHCFGLAASASRDIASIAGRGDVALVLGSESHGLDGAADGLELLRIPMAREVESLNVAAAGAIALHALAVVGANDPYGAPST